MIQSYRTDLLPLLPAIAQKILECFTASQQGCFLWVSGAILREFSEDRDAVDTSTTDSVYQFFEELTLVMLRALDKLPPEELPDGMFASSA